MSEVKYILLAALVVAVEVWILLTLTGCTTVNYNPETHDFHYSSPPWGRKIGSVSVIREADNSILFEMTDYQTENISEIAGAVAEGVVKGLK